MMPKRMRKAAFSAMEMQGEAAIRQAETNGRKGVFMGRNVQDSVPPGPGDRPGWTNFMRICEIEADLGN